MSILSVVGVFLFAFGILLSIALHEVGHLLPAKRFGVRVTQYMVGFGPTIWSTRKGDTEYGVKWIPLGGYIRMIGMFPPHPGSDGRRLRRAGTGPFHAMVADARRDVLEELQPGDDNRVFYKLPVPQRLVIMLGGPVMNLFIAVVLFTISLTAFGLLEGTAKISNVSACVDPDAVTCPGGQSPAATVGIQKDDRILSVDGRRVDSWEDLQGAIRAAGLGPATVVVERDGQQLTLKPDLVEVERRVGDGTTRQKVPFLGVGPTAELVRQPVSTVPGTIVSYAARTFGAVVSVPERMVGVAKAAFGGEERDPNGPIGVVGASRLGAEVATADAPASWRVADFLNLLAALNLALFVFNLLPVLPLDGGHVAGALWEGARRRIARVRGRPDPGPFDAARLLPVAYVVAMVFVGMSALLLYADLVNPVRLPD
jgi:membrane-associated protease RseP (regulator of RpoE activity)